MKIQVLTAGNKNEGSEPGFKFMFSPHESRKDSDALESMKALPKEHR